MVSRWAIVRAGMVENVCLWDGDWSTWNPGPGVGLVPVADRPDVGIGYRWDGVTLTPPDVDEPAPPAEESP